MSGTTPSIVAKRYQILNELGHGGMGVVYRVKHCFTGELLALKMLNDDLMRRDRESLPGQRKRAKTRQFGVPADPLESPWAARFKREMQISARVASEHVVRVTDADVAPEAGGSLFYVMELLQGADLERLLQERHPLSAEETVWIICQLAEALDKAHKAGIVHRDLKPANCFLHRKENNELIVKLLDFGLAFLTSESQESDSKEKLTQTGATLGTLNYFAPEQAIGQRDKIGPPTDIWAVGIIVFELLTGQCYFPGSDHTVAVKIARGQLTPPSERVQTLSKDFDKWFYKSCDLDPSKRWASLPEQAAALGEALGISAAAMESAPAPASLSDWVAARLKNNQGDQAGAPVDPLAVTDASGPTGKAVQVIAKTGVLAKPPPKRTSLVSRVLDGQSWRRSTVIIGICGLIALLVFVLAFLFRRDGGIVPRPDSQVQPRDAAKQPPNVSAKTATEPGVPSPATPTAAETSDADADADKLFHHGKKKHKPQRGGKHTPAAKSTSPGEFDPAAP